VLRQDGVLIWSLNHLCVDKNPSHYRNNFQSRFLSLTFSFAEIGTFSPEGSATTPQLNVVFSPELVGTLFAVIHQFFVSKRCVERELLIAITYLLFPRKAGCITLHLCNSLSQCFPYCPPLTSPAR
jgi:hypothetical protein